MLIKKILVPVDFSPPSTLAVNCGVALARKLRAKLTLLHVVESPAAFTYTFPAEIEKIEKQRTKQAEIMLPALVGAENLDNLDLGFIVRPADIEATIDSVIREEQADLVVMGTHGRGLFGRLFVGSVAETLLRKLTIPILTVCRVSSPLEFKTVLFATDLGDDSDSGFQFASELASATGASLVVAHVIDKRPVLTYETPEVKEVFDEERRQAISQTREKFAEFEAQAKRSKLEIATVLAEGEAAEALVRIADEHAADFIIVGIRKKGPIARTLLGSTAEPVIRAAHVPVLSVPISNSGSLPRDHRVFVFWRAAR
jgi:nucleotide-binding universal stress UspA family protein